MDDHVIQNDISLFCRRCVQYDVNSYLCTLLCPITIVRGCLLFTEFLHRDVRA